MPSSDDAPGSAASSVASLPETKPEQPTSVLDRIYHRTVAPTDLRPCHALESTSYPPDEAASLSTLQYRQHHAAKYFRCSGLMPDDATATESMKLSGKIVGFVTGTRCWDFDDESLAVHDPRGPLLAIHSVVVDKEYRGQGVGGAMLVEYVRAIRRMELNYPLDRIVLMAKAAKLAFYVRAGFQVVGVSPIVHGRDVWYECSLDVRRPEDGAVASSASGAAAPRLLGLGDSTTGARPCWIVDSFADPTRAGGSGNPAAVVLCPPGTGPGSGGGGKGGEKKSVDWMRTVAMEFNLSETAFVWERQGKEATAGGGASGGSSRSLCGGGDDGASEVRYTIRYFTRTGAEVDLCGHATLASASVLLQAAAADRMRRTEVSSIAFYARNDVLRATVAANGKAGDNTGSGSDKGSGGSSSSSSAPNLRIAMDFPWRSVKKVDAPADRTAVLTMLKSAFGIEDVKGEGVKEESDDGGENRTILYLGIDSVGEDLLVELTPDAFGKIGPDGSSNIDISALGAWGGGYKRGVILCCQVSKKGGDASSGGCGGKKAEDDDSGIDFLSRFFGPKVGIDEDPVTGSAHCTLGPYFGTKIGRSRVVGRQASSRGGIVECVLQERGGEGEERTRRVGIVGTAVTTMTGTLHI